MNEVLWDEVRSLYGLDPNDDSYTVHIDDDGQSTIMFGDGEQGARLPTGQANIRATYRHGLGRAGNLPADSLSLLKTSPPGIAEVINPVPAVGGAEPETGATAKIKAPPTVRTLDRIVSLQDFEDFAQGFVGIGKAQALPIRQRGQQTVHITIAGIDGSAIEPTTQLYQSLVNAINESRDPFQVAMQVASYPKNVCFIWPLSW